MEVVITMVVIGIAVTALITALASLTNSAKSHRDGVVADAIMRNSAEAVKSAADTCTAGATMSPAYPALGTFGLTTTPTILTCPDTTTSLTVTLRVTTPKGIATSMQMVVRTP